MDHIAHLLALAIERGEMAIFCDLLVGYSERRKGGLIVFILPIVVSVSFFLIADLDSPRGGAIRVHRICWSCNNP
jgi:hypothetical protein